MRQVPEIPSYLLIGGGRLARHMAHYLNSLGASLTLWNRHDHSTATLVSALNQNPYTLLCINDDQIEGFYKNFADHPTQFVHFSGALNVEEVLGFHPLMSFGAKLYDLETYKAIHFIGTESKEVFKKVFAKFENPYSEISPEQKALYHGVCVLGGNGTTLLWELLANEFQKMGLPEEAMLPYLKQTTENILQQSEGRWTGPWYRKDIETIEKNTKALANQDLGTLYQEMERLSHRIGRFHDKHK